MGDEGLSGVASTDEQKRAAALAALAHVKDGMRLGLGTGSTAAFFVAGLGERVKGGLRVICVPTSEATRRHAEGLGIALASLDGMPGLDLTVDGADEIDGDLDLIKGGGGALLREKIVAAASDRVIIIAEAAKKVAGLGRYPLPVEIVPFGATSTLRQIAEVVGPLGVPGPTLHLKDGQPFRTDNGNFVCRLPLGRIVDKRGLAATLSAIPGVVEHGLFLCLADMAFIGTAEGVETLEKKGR